MLALTCAITGCMTLPPAAPPPAASTVGQTAALPSPARPTTIWDFLGLTGVFQGIHVFAACTLNKVATRFPALEPVPPLTALADPANLNSPVPAVAAAASVKAEENAAPQKIQALVYLGSVGCGGCYPDVEKALLAGLDDCTEQVRFTAVSVLASTSRNRCRYCDSGRCCSPAVKKKLRSIATEFNKNGCHKEPSARVRRMARIALCQCACESIEDLLQLDPEIPLEGPSSESELPAPSVSNLDLPKKPVELASFQETGVEPTPLTKLQSRFPETQLAGHSVDRTVGPDSELDSALQILNESDTEKSSYRIRWEVAAVSIRQMKSKDRAEMVMNYVQQMALGQLTKTPSALELSQVTTRQIGWSSPQDVRSPKLAQLLAELPVGEVSPVIEEGGWLLVCRVLEKSTVAPDPEGSFLSPSFAGNQKNRHE